MFDSVQTFTALLFFIACLLCGVVLFVNGTRAKSLVAGYFGCSSLLASCTVLPYWIQLDYAHYFYEWGMILSITFSLSALFVLIRNSKPVFARFPVSFTLLPFVVPLGFPFLVESDVLENLLIALYQGGALVVGILMFFMNHNFKEKQWFTVLSGGAFLAGFILHWFWLYPGEKPISEAVFLFVIAGMILLTLGLRLQTLNTINGYES